MAVGILHSVTALMAACSRQVSRMSRRLLGRPGSFDERAKIAPSWAPYLTRRISLIPLRSFGNNNKHSEDKNKKKTTTTTKMMMKKTKKKKKKEAPHRDDDEKEEVVDRQKGEEESWERGEGVWNKTILMGDKCQTLDFSGAIHYDNEGKQLQQLPPRSPLRSQLPCFSFPVVTAAAEKGVVGATS